MWLARVWESLLTVLSVASNLIPEQNTLLKTNDPSLSHRNASSVAYISPDTREDFHLRYVFFHDLQDSNSPPEMKHVGELSRITNNNIVVRPMRLASKPWPAIHNELSPGQEDLPNPSSFDDPAHSGPDVSDRSTIVNLAKMSSDAYVLNPDQPDWLNSSLKFNYSSSFGWDSDGLRGHVFTDTWNRTVIVAFKGTTIDPREKWRAKDRLNDNILFSCCCAEQRPDPYPYGAVCGCRTNVYECNSTCLTQEMAQEDRYYGSALSVMFNVTNMFPDSIIWVTGHSLGGAIASLVGSTFRYPAVTFEAPPQRLPAMRLGLDQPSRLAAYHFGNTADPIFMGACTGWSASCSIGGYAFESQCFTGKRCVYDTVGDLGWHLNIGNHRINTVITDVLEKYNTTPPCEVDDECVDCYNWSFKPAP